MKTDNEQPTAPTWLTPVKMAERVRLHPKTLLRLAQRRVIPCLRAGRVIRFEPDAVEQALIQQADAA